MSQLTLVFDPAIPRSQVLATLNDEESGFEVDPFAPMKSTLELGVAVAGTLLSAAQLACALRALKDDHPGSTIKVELPDGSSVTLTSTDPALIENVLDQAIQRSDADSASNPS